MEVGRGDPPLSTVFRLESLVDGLDMLRHSSAELPSVPSELCKSELTA